MKFQLKLQNYFGDSLPNYSKMSLEEISVRILKTTHKHRKKINK